MRKHVNSNMIQKRRQLIHQREKGVRMTQPRMLIKPRMSGSRIFCSAWCEQRFDRGGSTGSCGRTCPRNGRPKAHPIKNGQSGGCFQRDGRTRDVRQDLCQGCKPALREGATRQQQHSLQRTQSSEAAGRGSADSGGRLYSPTAVFWIVRSDEN